jgi:hypothetical protein
LNRQSVSEATKIAAMRAKQNIAEFMNNDINSDKSVDIVTKSVKTSSNGTDKRSQEDNGADTNSDSDDKSDSEMNAHETKTLITVMERIRDNSNAILRGVQITNQSVSPESVWVEVTVSKQSIAASESLRTTMNVL